MVDFLPYYVDMFAGISPRWLVRLLYSGPNKVVSGNEAAPV